jgi:hypothetical protein
MNFQPADQTFVSAERRASIVITKNSNSFHRDVEIPPNTAGFPCPDNKNIVSANGLVETGYLEYDQHVLCTGDPTLPTAPCGCASSQ